jgi:hypothetical protein
MLRGSLYGVTMPGNAYRPELIFHQGSQFGIERVAYKRERTEP